MPLRTKISPLQKSDSPMPPRVRVQTFLPKPTLTEYRDNKLMRQAVEAGLQQFLKVKVNGLIVDNIMSEGFIRATFSFTDSQGVIKGFGGKALLDQRGIRLRKPEIVKLLRDELGLAVAGEVVETEKLPLPTEEEYQDNDLMRRAIEAGKAIFLRKPQLGFTIGNILASLFSHKTFTFTDAQGVVKGFTGGTLLKKRGKEKAKDQGLIPFLRELGITVEGEVVKKERYSRATAADYADAELMRRTIEANKHKFLNDPELGFTVENINTSAFYRQPLVFIDCAGKRKAFIGETLLGQRGKEKTKEGGIVPLLRDLGIEVEGEAKKITRPNPPEDYSDNELIGGAIEAEKDKILKEPKLGFTFRNLRTNEFLFTNFTYIDRKGEPRHFTGYTLLLKKGLLVRKSGLVALLKELGIELAGEVELKEILPKPTEAEYQDNELMRQVIEAGKHQFLIDPEKGFAEGNITSKGFFLGKFTFFDAAGEKKGFVGETLLRKRGKWLRIKTGIIPLLEELGIKVETETKVQEAFSSTELAAISERYELDKMIAALIDHPADLAQVISIFCPDKFTSRQIKGLVKGFTELHLSNEAAGPGIRSKFSFGKGTNQDETFIAALMKRQELLKRVSEEELLILIDIHKRLVYPKFVSDFNAALQELTAKAARTESPKIKRIYESTIEAYQQAVAGEVPNILTELFLFQRMKVRFLMDHDQAILADEPGLGKTLTALAAVETLGLKKVLVVCPSTVKDIWQEEIRKHTRELPEIILIEGSRRERDKRYEAARRTKYIIVNYEELREKTAEELKDLTDDLELVIADEAQNIDNIESQQGTAIRRIHPRRKWLLSATPYNNKPENMFHQLSYLFPEKYQDYRLFLETYCKDTQGLKLLNGELRHIMVRSRKLDVFTEYDPTLPLETQGVKLPKKIEVPYEQQGKYTLNQEQVHIIGKMFDDFRNWARSFNARVAKADKIKLDNINPLIKLQYLFYATIDPELVGGTAESPLYPALDKIIAEKIGAGKKILLFARHRPVVEKLMKRYERLGVARIDGAVKGWAKDQAGNELKFRYNGLGRLVVDPVNGGKIHAQAYERHRFQEDPNVRIMVANEKSGGAGLTLTAADVVIYAEKPMTYTRVFQSSERAHRIDKLRRKATVEVISMVGVYPAEERTREHFQPGTVSELLEELLRVKRKLFVLVMDGIVDEAEIDSEFAKSVIGMIPGFYFDVLPETRRGKRMAKGGEIVGDFYPVLELARDKEEEQLIIRTAANFMRTEVKAEALAKTIAEIPNFDLRDLELVSANFENKNKYLQDQVLIRLPQFLKRLYAKGQTLTTAAAALPGRFTRINLLIVMITGGEQVLTGFFLDLLGKIDAITKTYAQNTLLHKMTAALANLSDENFIAFLSRHLVIIQELAVDAQIRFLERMSLMRKVGSKSYKGFVKNQYSDFTTLNAELERSFLGDFRQEFELEGVTEERIAEVYREWGSFDQILGLYGGMKLQGEKYAGELARFKEIVKHIFVGDYRPWRNDDYEHVAYLSGQKEFWARWNQEAVTRHEEVTVPAKAGIKRLYTEYLYLWKVLVKRLGRYEGEAVAQQLPDLLATSPETRVAKLEQIDQQIREISRKLQTTRDERLAQTREELRSLAVWLEISHSIKEAQQTDTDFGRLIDLLQKRINKYSLLKKAAVEDNELGEVILQMKRIVQLLRSLRSDATRSAVEIIDTDDPRLIMERGSFNPEMIDCFNYHGNPKQTSTLVDPLGSKNKRLIIAQQEGRIMAVALAKIRQDEEGNPVIFLERALYRGGYDFQAEMVEHLINHKADQAALPIKVAVQTVVKKQADARYIYVTSTGSFAENEYVEALFGVRPERRVRHVAKLVYEKKKEE